MIFGIWYLLLFSHFCHLAIIFNFDFGKTAKKVVINFHLLSKINGKLHLEFVMLYIYNNIAKIRNVYALLFVHFSAVISISIWNLMKLIVYENMVRVWANFVSSLSWGWPSIFKFFFYFFYLTWSFVAASV